MFCRSLFIASFLCCVGAIRADMAIPAPGIDRIAAADAVVVGRVVAIEPQDIEVAIAPGSKEKVKYRVAVVNVTEVVLGKKETKTLRVGFVPVSEKEPIRRRYPLFDFKLEMGDHGLLFLRKHPSESFLIGRMYFDYVPYSDANKLAPMPVGRFSTGSYPTELQKARQAARLLADPLGTLRSKDATDRYTVAAHLVFRYRTPPMPGAKQEPISAEESQLILTSILEQNWKVASTLPAGWQCFNMLGLAEKDGWKAPRQVADLNELRSIAQAWHRDHGQNYRIQRFVHGTK